LKGGSISLKDRVYKILPAVDSLRGYGSFQARRDILAGLTVAAVAVPQAMAYALIIGLPPIYGLYTAIVMTAIGAIFDSSKQLINGPTNAISIAVLSAVAFIDGPEERIAAVIMITFMVGIIQLAISLFRLGDVTRYVSHSVIVGFTFGAGSLLVIDQMKNLLGIPAVGDAHDHLLVRFWLTMTQGGGIHTETTVVGLGTIVAIILLRLIKRWLKWPLLPELFIVVCLSCAAVAWLDLDQRGVKVVGAIPASLPTFKVPKLDRDLMEQLASSAAAIALLGLLEAISMAKAIAARTRQRLDMNQQCLSEAMANLGGSFFQCIPGSGSLTRSAINTQAGCATQWSGVISAIGVASIMMVFAPYAQYLPRATLAGILLVASYGMVDWKALAYHWRATKFDAAIVFATAFSAMAISVEFCVMVGVLMSFMLTVPRVGRLSLSEFVVGAHGVIHERLVQDKACEKILIFGLEGEMFFGALTSLERHFQAIEDRITPATTVVILRLRRARNADAVAMAELQEFVLRLKARNVHVLMCGVSPDLHAVMKSVGLVQELRERIFLEQPIRKTSTVRAVEHAYAIIGERCANCTWSGQLSMAELKSAAAYQ
jgi:SulP family sulfate permease